MGFFKKEKETAVVRAAAAAEAVTDAAANAAPEEIGELYAVIAAAVAAYESEQYRATLQIRRLDRTAGTRPAWGCMGMQESIDVRRM